MKSVTSRLVAGPGAAFVGAILFTGACDGLHQVFPKLVSGDFQLFRQSKLMLEGMFLGYAFWIAVIGAFVAAPLIGRLRWLRRRACRHFALAGALLGGVLFGLETWFGKLSASGGALIPAWGFVLAGFLFVPAVGFSVHWRCNVQRVAGVQSQRT